MTKHDPMVFIVDDDDSLRYAISWLLATVNIQTQEFGSAMAFLDAYKPVSPACLLLDLRMPEMSGLRLQEEMMKREIHLPIIFLTSFGEVNTAVQAMKMGAVDFLGKPFNNQHLLDLVQRVLTEQVLSEVDSVHPVKRRDERLNKLSSRENDVFSKLVEGKVNKVVASELGISIKTVEFHRSRIMKKLEVQTIADLIAITR